MSDILDDLKMMADHLDRENGDEPCDLGMLLVRAIAEIRKLRGQPVSAAEVPLPEQAGWAVEMHGACVLFANNAEKAAGRSPGAKTRVYTEAQALAMMRTYGDAREAAGYAAGAAAGGKDAERYRWLRDKSVPPHNFYLSVPVEFADVRYTSDQVDAAIDAALRGEVK